MAICRINGNRTIVRFKPFDFWEAGKIGLNIYEEGCEDKPLIGDFFGVDFSIEEAKEFADKLTDAILLYEADERSYLEYLKREKDDKI